GSAVVSALSTGQVMVISLGRTETTRHMVHWSNGWARFAGPSMMVAALVLYAVLSSRNVQLWWTAVALAFAGICLLLYSAWFVSLRGATAFALFAAFIAVCFWVDARFGRG